MSPNTVAPTDALRRLQERSLEPLQASSRLSARLWSENREAARAVGDLALRHAMRIGQSLRQQGDRLEHDAETPQHQLFDPARWWQWGPDWLAYATDAMQRQVLTLDAFRERGNTFAAHEAAGMPPVLDFEYEVVVDGHTLERPVNYSLLRLHPPEGRLIDEDKRPFMVVDPRAGHGAGIGGFKADSQVGEAFADGHPVYFVSFRPVPEPGQTLADVRDAEIHFLHEIARLHPQSPRPVVIGNCQGGWATMVLAASAPEAVGPVVINGAPMSYWAGKSGENPMRYLGGLAGGALPALLLSDLGAGVFDGSSLVLNFESLNPSNSLFRKYYHLYANIDTEAPRFLEFERWWGGFFLMNEEEIRWIVENLFIGNRLARGEASLGGERIDLRRIRSPIVVFASHGDNITPPQQALNWIADLYSDVDEIKALGLRIVYMVHESIGHLGIFVSGKVAGREHAAITDTMRAIEALPPGLYEMRLDDGEDRLHVRLEPRTIDDILHIDDGREDEQLFASVARLSEFATELYSMTVRPFVRAAVTPASAQAFRELAPIRQRRMAYADARNPWMPLVGRWADLVRANRRPVAADNPFHELEGLAAQWIETQLDLYRDLRDSWRELSFHAIYRSPALRALGAESLADSQHRRHRDLRNLPEVREALDGIARGGVAEAAARILCLLAKARGYVRRSRLERLAEAFREHGLFSSMEDGTLSALMHHQALVCDLEPQQAVRTLPLLLPSAAEREQALALVAEITGTREAMNPAAQKLLMQLEQLLHDAPLADGGDLPADAPAPLSAGHDVAAEWLPGAHVPEAGPRAAASPAPRARAARGTSKSAPAADPAHEGEVS